MRDLSKGPRPLPYIDGGHLILPVDDGADRRIPLRDIALVGEHTDVGGAYVEDYWLTLVLNDEQTLKIGSEDFAFTPLYSLLGNALAGTAFIPGLCNQSTFASRILWPTEHVGAPMLTTSNIDAAAGPHWSTVARKVITDRGYAH